MHQIIIILLGGHLHQFVSEYIFILFLLKTHLK